MGSKNDPAGNAPLPQFLQNLIGVRQRTRRGLAANFSRRSHRQDLRQVLPRTDGGSLHADFAGRQENRRKANVFGGQADNKKISTGPNAGEGHVVGFLRCRGHKRRMNSAPIPKFLGHIGRSSMEGVASAKRFGESEFFLGDVHRGDFRAKRATDLHRKVP